MLRKLVGLLVLVAIVVAGCLVARSPKRRPVTDSERGRAMYRALYQGVMEDYEVTIVSLKYDINGTDYWEFEYELARYLVAPKDLPRRILAKATWDTISWTSIYLEGFPDEKRGQNGYRYNPFGSRYGPYEVWDPCRADAGMQPYTGHVMVVTTNLLRQARDAVLNRDHLVIEEVSRPPRP